MPNWSVSLTRPQCYCWALFVNLLRLKWLLGVTLTGHAWRTYQSGKRMICGVKIPDGMKEHQKFPVPIITPSTKADQGHDEDISREEIISQGLVSDKLSEIGRLHS